MSSEKTASNATKTPLTTLYHEYEGYGETKRQAPSDTTQPSTSTSLEVPHLSPIQSAPNTIIETKTKQQAQPATPELFILEEHRQKLRENKCKTFDLSQQLRQADSLHGAIMGRHSGSIRAMAVLPHGVLASAGVNDIQIRQTDAKGTHLHTLLTTAIGKIIMLTRLQWKEEPYLIGATYDGSLHAWAGSGSYSYKSKIPAERTGGVFKLAALARGGLATVSRDGSLRVWWGVEGMYTKLTGHTGSVQQLLSL